MARDGSGNYSLPLSDVVTGTTILAAWANPTMADVAAALTDSIAKDGQTNPSANLPMNGYKHTGTAAGSARTDYARVAEMQNNTYVYGGIAGGTVNALTLSLSPALTAYTAGLRILFLSLGQNTTTTATINVNGLGVKSIKRNGTGVTDIRPGDMPAVTGVVEIVYDGTSFRLINPEQETRGRYAYTGYLTSNQNIPDATSTILTGFTDELDDGSRFGIYYYVVQDPGFYEISFSASLQSDIVNPTEFFGAYLTDSTGAVTYLYGSTAGPSPAAASSVLVSSGTGILKFATLDELSITVLHRTGTARNVLGGTNKTRLAVKFLGP